MKEFIFPKRVALAQCASDPSALLKKQPLQIDLFEKHTAHFQAGDFIVLDFGKEMCGGVRILTTEPKAEKIRIRFGESLSESCAELGGAQNATNDHALRDLETALPMYSDMTFANTGFRFVRLDFFGEVRIKSVIAVNHILKRREIYAYQGEDARIREIFAAAKRTVDLCASSGLVWDGVKRDRLVWIGDMEPEMLALATLYGRVPAIEKSLDFVRKQTRLPRWMNDFPTYSMWWIIILADYHARVGAEDFVSRQMDYLCDLVEQMSDCVHEDGSMHYPFYFLDWPTHEKPDEIHGVRAINIIAMKRAITLLEGFGRSAKTARKVLARLLKIEIAPKESKQVLGLKYFATELTEADKKMLVRGGAKGMSTFMSYFILKAVASFDRAAATRMMKEYYGAMLDKGATTFWEDFDLSWAEGSGRIDALPQDGERDIHGDFGAFCYVGFRHSLCHGWSAGVIAFIKEEC